MDDLRGRNAPAKMSLGTAGKIVGAAIVAVAICGIGAYSYETGMWKPHPKQVVADSQLPSPTSPQQ
jgi:hypothetical protein